ncbi:MAG TPA: 3-oxoadipate enol-lactonase [Mycobacteriales bacterium]|jgi:3-oxoadipate enol-lactonase|nr:3-oxoadipate enol-lactonase [Mycobacteriales bacterium]
MSGVRLYAEISGPPDGAVVVMGSSLGSTSRMWQAAAEKLADRYRVVVFDTRGHGRSPVPPGPYAIGDLGADVLVTLGALGVEEFSYVGLSLGGQIGIWLASEAPDRVRRLSLWSTAAKIATPESWQERAAAVRAGGTAAIADAVVVRWFTPEYAQTNPGEVKSWRDEIASIPAEGYAGCCDALATSNLTARLPAITAPTLVVAGSQDPTTPPALLADLAERITSSRFEVVAPAAHLTPLEQPTATVELLLDHLGREDTDGRR